MYDVKILKLTQDEIPNYLNYGSKNAPCVLYGIHDKPFAWICQEEKCDYDYILKNNINHIKINGAGATIVCSPDDLDLGFFGTKEFCEEMLNKIIRLVSNKLTKGRFVNNDFMYGDKKHGSFTRMDLGKCYYIGVHLSNNIDTELINSICKKVSYKTPSELPFPITEEDIIKLYCQGDNYGDNI